MWSFPHTLEHFGRDFFTTDLEAIELKMAAETTKNAIHVLNPRNMAE